jgi:hypothetical protein
MSVFKHKLLSIFLLVHKQAYNTGPTQEEKQYYNLQHSLASSLRGISSSPHCKMEWIIVKRSTYEDACKHLTTTLKYHNQNNAIHEEINRTPSHDVVWYIRESSHMNNNFHKKSSSATLTNFIHFPPFCCNHSLHYLAQTTFHARHSELSTPDPIRYKNSVNTHCND